MKHGSLFSGIGGFDLAAEWMGWENVFHCEWMEFPRKVLEYYWPDADSHIDICKTEFKKYANRIDILTGGFPCQPFSLAGKRKGTDDERYLWGEMLRAICEIKPTWVIAENVFGITNIDGGLVFEQVCLDLEAQGYEVQSFIIPAAAKNAPHRRDRCWFIAQNTNQNGWRSDQRKEKPNIGKFRNTCAGNHERLCLPKGIATNTDNTGNTTQRSGINGNGAQESSEWEQPLHEFGRPIIEGNAADTKCARLEYGNQTGNIRIKKRTSCSKGSKSSNELTTNGNVKHNVTNTNGFRLRRESNRIGNTKFNSKDNAPNDWQNFPTQSPVCGGDDGLPTKLDGITFSKWRNESIKGYGNAIVPQIAYQLFQIIEHETKNKTTKETKQQDIFPGIGD
jgi:DNA (cytosine-5)-methyltransferase 1